MMRTRAVLAVLLALAVGLSAAAPAVALADRRQAALDRPGGFFLAGLWREVLGFFGELGLRPAVAAGEGTPLPPPQPTGRGGMDPNG